MPVPYFTVLADGVDISGNLRGTGVSMTITDNDGLDEDRLQIVIDDIEGSVIAPRTGAILNPVGGYLDGRMRDFGLFSVDSVSYDGWPQTITIQAKSVVAKSLEKQREPKAYTSDKFPTYGDIFSDIAGKIEVGLKIADAIRSKKNPSEHQTEEGALEFLDRLGEKLNASITVKGMTLCVVEKGKEMSAGGGSLDRVHVTRGVNLLGYSATERDDPKYKEVEATYYDRDKNSRETVKEETGLDGPTFLIRQPYQNKQDAENAVKSQAQALVRASGEANFEIDGEPFAQAEAYAVVSGCRERVDGLWRIKTVTHQFSSTAPYTTSLACTAPPLGKQ